MASCSSMMASKSKIAYTTREKMLLTELVGQNSSIIENKCTNGSTWAEKQSAWELITSQYNALPEIKTRRTVDQLKKLWANLKQQRRKDITVQKQEMFRTGGGEVTFKKTADTPIMELIDSVAPHLDMELDFHNWDSNENQLEKPSSTLESNQMEAAVAVNSTPRNSFETPTVAGSSKPKSFSQRPISRNYKLSKQYVDKEKELRIQKIKDAIKQQAELHQMKMEMALVELECAKIRLQREKMLQMKQINNS